MKRGIINNIIITILIFTISIFLTSCKDNKNNSNNNHPIVCIYLTNGMKIKLELYEDIAPITVEHFLKLVDEDYYDGTIFHRVIQDFMIQGGGYIIKYSETEKKNLVTKNPKPCDSIVGEFSENGYENDIMHLPGVISMARSDDYNSATGQFFICSTDTPSLDGRYAAFGKCVDQESLNNVIAISNLETFKMSANFQYMPKDVMNYRIDTIVRLK